MQTIRVTLHPIPAAFQTWPMLESMGQQGGSGADSHLCTKLKEHGVISEEEYEIVNAVSSFRLYGYRHLRKELLVYLEHAPEVLEALESQHFDWSTLRPFADELLQLVHANQLEAACKLLTKTMFDLKDRAGQPITNLQVLDVALACK